MISFASLLANSPTASSGSYRLRRFGTEWLAAAGRTRGSYADQNLGQVVSGHGNAERASEPLPPTVQGSEGRQPRWTHRHVAGEGQQGVGHVESPRLDRDGQICWRFQGTCYRAHDPGWSFKPPSGVELQTGIVVVSTLPSRTAENCIRRCSRKAEFVGETLVSGPNLKPLVARTRWWPRAKPHPPQLNRRS
jgi:hypothetical protein